MMKKNIKRLAVVTLLAPILSFQAGLWAEAGANAEAAASLVRSGSFGPLRLAPETLTASSIASSSPLAPVAALNELPPEPAPQNNQEQPVEQVQKNIQALKGMPAAQLLPVMHQMRAALGVRCDYCHIAENGKYWMDDKPAKQIARQHLLMTFELNKARFGGQPIITCNTCHQGQVKPISVPPIGQGAFANTTRAEPDEQRPAPLPSAEQIFDHYVRALGGQAAVEKITTRVTKATLLRSQLVNSGTPRAAVINRGETWTIETFQKTPGQYLAVITTPDGVIYQGFNGVTGWTKTPDGQRELSTVEIARIKRQADFFKDLKLRDQYAQVSVSGTERIGNREAYVIEAQSLDNKAEKLFFDAQSGLLLRRIVFTNTVLGKNPEQTDFEDYREVDGVRLAFTIRVSSLDDNHFGTTRNFIEVKHNVPVADVKFDIPAAVKNDEK